MFIKTSVRKKNNKEYRTEYLTKWYRDKVSGKVKHETILNLSKLPSKLLLAMRASLNWNTKIEKSKFEDLEVNDVREYWSTAIFWKIFDKYFSNLIDKKYQNVIRAIVINKIFDPKSKNALNNWLKQVDLWYMITNKNDLYQCLDYLEESQESIEQKLIKKAKRNKNENFDLLLYDITSTYFEWKWAEEMCKYWYSRDHRSDRVQVNIWLVTDSNWTPITVEIFEWNKWDKQTIKNKVDELKDKFWIKDITFVFDRWMKTKSNLDYLYNEWYDYITALSHSELRIKSEENNEIQLSIFDKKNLAEFEIEEEVVINDENWDPIKVEIEVKNKKWKPTKKTVDKTKTIKKKLVLCHNPSKAKLDELSRKKLIEKTINRLVEIQSFKKNYSASELQDKVSKSINRFKCEKYVNYSITEEESKVSSKKTKKTKKNEKNETIKIWKLSFTINQDKVDLDDKYNWFYMIESTNAEIEWKEAENKYKSLQLVERAFDDVKNHIEIRPVFHYKESRIKWHIFTCFMSYYLLHKFREKTRDMLKMDTLDTLLTELKCIKKTYFKLWNFLFDKINKLNEKQKEILQIFKISINT